MKHLQHARVAPVTTERVQQGLGRQCPRTARVLVELLQGSSVAAGCRRRVRAAMDRSHAAEAHRS